MSGKLPANQVAPLQARKEVARRRERGATPECCFCSPALVCACATIKLSKQQCEDKVKELLVSGRGATDLPAQCTPFAKQRSLSLCVGSKSRALKVS